MERDPKISRMIREGGLERAPEGFTDQVMNLIASVPERKSYKPLIGKGGQIIIILLGLSLVIIATIFAEPGSSFMQAGDFFSGLEWKIPEFNLNLDFFSGINISGGIAAALIAIFILVLADAGLGRRRLV